MAEIRKSGRKKFQLALLWISMLVFLLGGTIAITDREAQKLAADLEQARMSLDEALNDRDECLAKLNSDLAKENAGSEDLIKRLVAEVGKLEDELKAKQSENEQCMKKQKNLRETVESQNNDEAIKRLYAQIDELHAANSDLTSQISTLKAQLSSESKSSADSKSALNEATQSSKQLQKELSQLKSTSSQEIEYWKGKTLELEQGLNIDERDKSLLDREKKELIDKVKSLESQLSSSASSTAHEQALKRRVQSIEAELHKEQQEREEEVKVLKSTIEDLLQKLKESEQVTKEAYEKLNKEIAASGKAVEQSQEEALKINNVLIKEEEKHIKVIDKMEKDYQKLLKEKKYLEESRQASEKQASEKLQESKAQVVALQKEVATLRSELEHKETLIGKEANDQLKQSNEALKDSRSQVVNLQHEIDELKSELEIKQKDVKAIAEDLMKEEEKHLKSIDDFSKIIKEHEEAKEKLQNQLAQLESASKGDVQKIKSETSQATETLTKEYEQKVQKLNAEIDSLKSEIAKLNKEKTDISTAASSANQDLQKTASDLMKEQEKHINQINELTKMIKELESDKINLSEKLQQTEQLGTDQIQKTTSELQKTIQILRSENEDLKTKFKQKEEDVSTVASDLMKEEEKHINQLNEITKRIKELEQEKAELVEKLDKMSDEAMRETERMMNEVNLSKGKEIAQLQKELDEARRELSALERENKDLLASREGTEKDVEKTATELMQEEEKHIKQIEELTKMIKELEKEKDEALKLNEILKNNYEKRSEGYRRDLKEAGDANKNLEDLIDKLKESDLKIKSLEKELKQAKSQISSQSGEVNSIQVLHAKIDEKEKENKKLEEELSHRKSAGSANEETYAKMIADLSAAEKKVSELQSKLTEVESQKPKEEKVSYTRQESGNADQILDDLTKELQVTQSQLKEKSEKLESMKPLADKNRDLEDLAEVLTKEANQATTALKEKEGQISSLKSEVKDKDDNIEQLKRQIRDKEAEKTKIAESIAKAQAEVQKKEEDLKQAQKLLQTSNEALKKMEADFKKSMESNDKDMELAAVTSDLHKAEKALADQMATFDRMLQDLKDAKKELEEKDAAISKLETELQKSVKHVDDLNDKIRRLEHEIERHKEDYNKSLEMIKDLKNTIAEKETVYKSAATSHDKMKAAEEVLDKMTADYNSLKEEMKTYEDRAQKAEKDLKSLREDYEPKSKELITKLEAANKDIEQHSKILEDLTKEANNLTELVKERDEQIIILKKSIEEKDEDSKTEIEALKTKVADLENEKKRLEEELKKVTEKAAEMEKIMEDLVKEANKSKNEESKLKELEVLLKQKAEEIESAEVRIKELEGKLHSLEEQLKQKIAEIEQLKSNLSEKEKTLEKLKDSDSKLSKLNEDTKKILEEKNKSLVDAEKHLREREDTIIDLTTQLKTLKEGGSVVAVEKKLREKEKALEEAEKNVKKLQETIATLQQRVQNNPEKSQDSKTSTDTLVEAERKLQETETALEEAERKLSQAEIELKSLRSELETRKNIAGSSDWLKSIEAAEKELKQKTKELQEQISSYEKSQKNAEKLEMEYKERVDRLKESTSSSNSGRKGDSGDLEKDIELKNKALVQAEKQLQQKDDELIQLQTDLDNYKREIETLKERVKVLEKEEKNGKNNNEEIRVLKDQIGELKKNIEKLTKENEDYHHMLATGQMKQSEPNNSKSKPSLLQKAYERIYSLTTHLKSLSPSSLFHHDHKNIEIVTKNGKTKAILRGTDKEAQISELMSALDSAYSQIQAHNLSLQRMTAQMQRLKDKHPEDLEELAERDETDSGKISDSTLHTDLGEVLAELDEAYAKIKQQEIQLAKQRQQLDSYGHESAPVSETSDKISEHSEGIFTRGKSLLTRAYEKIHDLSEKLLHHEQYPRHKQIEEWKHKDVSKLNDKDRQIYELLQDLDEAYARIKGLQSELTTSSEHMEAYFSHSKTGHHDKGSIVKSTDELISELEHAQHRIDELEILVEKLSHDLDEAKHNSVAQEKKNGTNNKQGKTVEEQGGKKKKNVLQRAFAKIVELTKKLREKELFSKKDSVDKYNKEKASLVAVDDKDAQIHELLEELDKAYKRLREYEAIAHRAELTIHHDNQDQKKGKMPEGEYLVSEMSKLVGEYEELQEELKHQKERNAELESKLEKLKDVDVNSSAKNDQRYNQLLAELSESLALVRNKDIYISSLRNEISVLANALAQTEVKLEQTEGDSELKLKDLETNLKKTQYTESNDSNDITILKFELKNANDAIKERDDMIAKLKNIKVYPNPYKEQPVDPDILPVSYSGFNDILRQRVKSKGGASSTERKSFDQKQDSEMTAEKYLNLGKEILHLPDRKKSGRVLVTALVDRIESLKTSLTAKPVDARPQEPLTCKPQQPTTSSTSVEEVERLKFDFSRLQESQQSHITREMELQRIIDVLNERIRVIERDNEDRVKREEVLAEKEEIFEIEDIRKPEESTFGESPYRYSGPIPSDSYSSSEYQDDEGENIEIQIPRVTKVNYEQPNYARKGYQDRQPSVAEILPTIRIMSPSYTAFGSQVFSIFPLSNYNPGYTEEKYVVASVGDHHHNYLAHLDLKTNNQEVLYKNGDYEKIIVDVAQVADKTVICDRDGKARIFLGTSFVHELRTPCFFQKLDYYAMSKVFAEGDGKLFYISKENRGKVVQVDMSRHGYPETIINFPIYDLFQIVHNGQGQLVGVGEESGLLVWLDVASKSIASSLQLEQGYIYRTLESRMQITIVNGIHKTETNTENKLFLVDKDHKIAASHIITYEGGHLGKYIHKMKLVFLKRSGLPVVGMVSHHYDTPNLYLFGLDRSGFVLIKKIERLHEKWIWDIAFDGENFLVGSSDGKVSQIKLEPAI